MINKDELRNFRLARFLPNHCGIPMDSTTKQKLAGSYGRDFTNDEKKQIIRGAKNLVKKLTSNDPA